MKGDERSPRPAEGMKGDERSPRPAAEAADAGLHRDAINIRPSLAAGMGPICGILVGVGARSWAGDLETPGSPWMRADMKIPTAAPLLLLDLVQP
ncbi:unnamed protein product [Urochloa humidicola]